MTTLTHEVKMRLPKINWFKIILVYLVALWLAVVTTMALLFLYAAGKNTGIL